MGTTIDFRAGDSSDTDTEKLFRNAALFCEAHLHEAPEEFVACAQKLVEQVKQIRETRTKAMELLPGLSFTVSDEFGHQIKFVHEEGANPFDEAKAFCLEHFPHAKPLEKCVDTMLRNAGQALDDIKAQHASGDWPKEEL